MRQTSERLPQTAAPPATRPPLPPSRPGGESEYVFVGRLDNLCSSYLAVDALIATSR